MSTSINSLRTNSGPQMQNGPRPGPQMQNGPIQQMPQGQQMSQMQNEPRQQMPQGQQMPPPPTQQSNHEAEENNNQNADELVDEILQELNESDPTSENFQEVEKPTQEVYKQSSPSLVDNVLNSLKLPVIVGIIILALSIPVVTSLFTKILPNKEIITNNINIIVPLLKGLLGGVLYFIASKFI